MFVPTSASFYVSAFTAGLTLEPTAKLKQKVGTWMRVGMQILADNRQMLTWGNLPG